METVGLAIGAAVRREATSAGDLTGPSRARPSRQRGAKANTGQPLHITSMRLRLANLGIPSMPGRARAIRELLRQAPAAIVVGMLRYSASKAGASQPDTGRPEALRAR